MVPIRGFLRFFHAFRIRLDFLEECRYRQAFTAV